MYHHVRLACGLLSYLASTNITQPNQPTRILACVYAGHNMQDVRFLHAMLMKEKDSGPAMMPVPS
jgi:hypothetical protein